MFWPDVIELKSFYGSVAGQVACLSLRRRVREVWPEARGETLLGIGYATPYLLPFLEKADLTIACMPAGQGVLHWPQGRDNLTLLVEEDALPFPSGIANRVLLVHALEHSEHARQLLAEAHRLLTPSGRLLVIVPNRRGLFWARSPSSPFAHGQPFTPGQLRRLLGASGFTPLSTLPALFFPPINWRLLLRFGRFIDAIGRAFFPAFSGVILMEAEKQIFAPLRGKTRPVMGRSPTVALGMATEMPFSAVFLTNP
jgi:SAM-dependent methyltransferase